MYPKSFVGRAPPGPAGGAYSAPPNPLAGFQGPTSKERKGGEGWEGEGKSGEGKEGGLLLRKGRGAEG